MNEHALREATAFLDDWLGYRAGTVDVPGFSVAVQLGDELVFSKAYGVADLETHEPLTTRHVFGVASQSKMFTATVVLQLAAEGKLALDDPVRQHLPWLAEHTDKRVREITVRQLLCHGAGLGRDTLEADYWVLAAPFPDQSALRKLVLANPLALEPNTALKYSNVGYALLGQVVEAVTGEPCTVSVGRIIKKLGLKSTLPDYDAAIGRQMATGHSLAFEGRRLPLRRGTTARAMASSVGVCSTAEDMCRFAAAHFWDDTRLVSRATHKEMQRVQNRVTDGYDTGMAFGLGLEMLRCSSRQLVGHSGHLAGHTTATWFDARDKLVVSVMTNRKDGPASQIVRGVFEALDHFGAHVAKPTPVHLARLQGRLYSHLATIQVVAAGGVLRLIDPDDWEPLTWPEELEYISPTELRVTTKGSVFGEGEVLRYTFKGDDLQSVRYAGTLLLPEAAYRRVRAKLQGDN
ncbi:MAG TPA: serine hydrolase domain-containing protein [Candidatus Saccharimonadales bacterium]|nr:serine hydrolase domain-containing protein [Candidatus Saccharimonadales bacterium]